MPRTSRAPLAITAAVACALLPLGAGSAAGVEAPVMEAFCSPTPDHRPVCPAGAPPEEAAFLDPTVRVTAPEQVEIAPQVYVGPFAVLAAGRGAPISIGAESNVQDNVRITGSVPRRLADVRALAAAGISVDAGVEIGERVILAHGSEVRGPARIGVDASEHDGPDPVGGEEAEEAEVGDDGQGDRSSEGVEVEAVTLQEGTLEEGHDEEGHDDGSEEEGQGEEELEDSGVFLSFGAQVDGAIIERDVQLSALSRVGPGVRVRSGLVVLPGKNITTQEEADDPKLGKVRPLLETDVEFNEAVIEVNLGLARSYADLFYDEASAVSGINVDPGGNVFDQSRDAPTVESDLCTGPDVRVPEFRNRVIGDVCFEDSLADLDRIMGTNISIRADEGGPFGIGTISEMEDRVIFHALEENVLRVGDRVSYGARSIVHGGGRPQVDPTTGLAAPTVVGNDVVLEPRSVVFRSLLRNGTRVGFKSAVVGSETAIDQEIPDRVIYANGDVFGLVEW
jgi:carbonic anhydrase/acetyltransferase-like protein (isoleucine patch superfamily)